MAEGNGGAGPGEGMAIVRHSPLTQWRSWSQEAGLGSLKKERLPESVGSLSREVCEQKRVTAHEGGHKGCLRIRGCVWN